MNHQEALESQAADRYLLNEMSEPERDAFEDHYFTCTACADDVRAGAALVKGVRAECAVEPPARESRTAVVEPLPARRWTDWFRWPVLAPAGAALALALLCGYQSLVLIPGLRGTAGASAVTATVLKATARGEDAPVVDLEAGPLAVLAMDVNGADAGAPLLYELQSPDSGTPVRGKAVAPPAGQPLLLVVPRSEVRASGAWTVVLRTASGMELARYPFQFKLK